MKKFYHGTTAIRHFYGIQKEGLRADMPRSYLVDEKHLGYLFFCDNQLDAREYGLQTLGLDNARDILITRIKEEEKKQGFEFQYKTDGVVMEGPPHSYLYDLRVLLERKKQKLREDLVDVIVILEVTVDEGYIEKDPEEEEHRKPTLSMIEVMYKLGGLSTEKLMEGRRMFGGEWYRYKGNLPPSKVKVVRAIKSNNWSERDWYIFHHAGKEGITTR